MSRRTKEEAMKTRARILTSALALFVRRGYAHTTFADIAAKMKMTKGAVYWHFSTKGDLLLALIAEMRAKFRRRLDALVSRHGLTFPSVAETMVDYAEQIVQNPRASAFFLLMHTQVRWGSDSMAKVREQLLLNSAAGPYHFLLAALREDIAAGRVSPETDPVGMASVCMSIWGGLVRAKLERCLQCDLAATMRRSYEAIWRSIAAEAKTVR